MEYFTCFGRINNQVADNFYKKILSLDSSCKGLTLFINSSGGDVSAVITMIAAIQYANFPVTISILGQALSASCILAAGPNIPKKWSGILL